MRLTNEAQSTKIVRVEDYKTFKGLLASPKLFALLIGYTVYIVLNAVLAILDDGLVMGIIDVVVHGLIAFSLWSFYLANKKDKSDKFSIKGYKIFQISHAVKYFIVFVLLVALLIMIIFSWINNANLANQAVAQVKNSTDTTLLVEALKNRLIINTSYIYFLILFLAFFIITTVYYKAVMCFVEGVKNYHEKGTHFEKDMKFLAIFSFVSAGALILFSIFSITNFTDDYLSLVSEVSYAPLFGGLGLFSSISRIVFAIILVIFGIVVFRGYKVLSNTVTYTEEEVTIE